MKRTYGIWTRTVSGLLVPTGRMADALTGSKGTYLDMKTRAEEIEALYTEDGVRLPPDSGLGCLIRGAKELWEHWFLDEAERLTFEMLLSGLHVLRIAEGLSSLQAEKDRTRYLRDLLSGTLDFLKREQSSAKNVFWELEVLTRLRKRTTGVGLVEPPDIVVDHGDLQIGIACKKLYSERHVQNVLSEAVHQVERGCEFGIVAVNIDDLVPGSALLCETDFDSLNERLHQINAEFLRRHDRHFRKYLSKGRLISVIVSTAVVADICREAPRFNNSYQWLVWTMPGLPEAQQAALERFYESVMD